ncbi:MAG: signal recognition particle-docking protein FtsY [Clostridiales bacterium]|nr:signal recognition particle-docking protein FtsY [Clostridiales bacterium]
MENQPSLFSRLRAGLFKSRQNLNDKMDGLVAEHQQVSEDFFDDLMDILVLSDMGADCAARAIDTLRAQVKDRRIKEAAQAKGLLKEILVGMLDMEKPSLHWPMVILMVGVNGVGKTTTIGKLALRFQGLGRSILLCAADTFRAAAVEQLTIWAERAKCPLVKHQEGADPAGVVFDAVQAAKARKADLLIVDTAGRLHNKKNLMDEMEKMRRVIDREYPQATVRCLLVVDATTGQNGLAQAKAFREAAGINGIVLTKLDGTAKGGIAFPIVRELQVPVMYVGVGEGIEDLQAFDAKEFVSALLD